jgi:hypothetical protein
VRDGDSIGPVVIRVAERSLKGLRPGYRVMKMKEMIGSPTLRSISSTRS